MKTCPKCKTKNPLGAIECDHCGVVFAHIRGNEPAPVDRSCPWNDHGVICGKPGSLSDGTLGLGPWYCSDHYWQLKGYPVGTVAHPVSYREQWYELRGLPYQPPKLGDIGTFKCIGGGMPMREPGED